MPLSSPVQPHMFCSQLFCLPFPLEEGTVGWRNEIAVMLWNTLFLPLLPPHTVPPLEYGVPPMKYSPSWTAPKRVLPTWCSTSELVHHGSFPWGSSPLAAASFRAHPFALAWGSSWTAGWTFAPPWSSPCVSEESLLWHLQHLHPLFIHWPCCLHSCFFHIFSFISLSCCCATGFFPLFNYVIPEVLPPLLMGSAFASNRPSLELSGIDSIRRGGNFWHLLTESTPAASLLPKTLPRKHSTILKM